MLQLFEEGKSIVKLQKERHFDFANCFFGHLGNFRKWTIRNREKLLPKEIYKIF